MNPVKVLLCGVLVVTYGPASSGQVVDQHGVFQVSFDEPSPLQQLYGEPIILKLRSAIKAPQVFHVRVFRGTIAEVTSLATRPTDIGDCVKYSTVTMPVSLNGAVHLPAPDNLSWLRPAGDGFLPETYVLVFESGEQPPDSAFSILRTQIGNYFKYAFELTIVPPDNLKEKVSDLVTSAAQTLAATAARFVKLASPCVAVMPTAMGDEKISGKTFEAAFLTPCGAPLKGVRTDQILYSGDSPVIDRNDNTEGFSGFISRARLLARKLCRGTSLDRLSMLKAL